MMYSVWLYRFNPGMTYSTVDTLRARGPEKVYPGCEYEGGTFLGRVWAHTNFTFGSVYRRRSLASAAPEVEDRDNLLRNLRILSPAVAAMEVRNIIPRDDAELKRLGEDDWHAEMAAPWIEAAQADTEIAYHLNVIGMSCVKNSTPPPYMIQAVWRDKLGFPPKWVGGVDARTKIKSVGKPTGDS